MRPFGKYVVIQLLKSQSSSGIVANHTNIGKIIAATHFTNSVGETVLFSSRKEYEQRGDIVFVPSEDILCVLDEGDY